ncbi:MAG TPA: hypothetical protein VFL13_13270 [Candidatus Baltobacteraceae bacterium]|nr:hypothetical protein [Candidatus Baltobacteraceae bacterium]
MIVRISGFVGLAILCVIGAYVVRPQFERTSVVLPGFCGTSAHASAYRRVALAYDGAVQVVANIDASRAPFAATALLVRKSDAKVLWRKTYGNDLISAAIADGILYIYNDKLADWIDVRTGLPVPMVMTVDNFGGLSSTNLPVLPHRETGRWYMETGAVISSWRRQGGLDLHRRVWFNSTAFNCFVDPAGRVRRLW